MAGRSVRASVVDLAKLNAPQRQAAGHGGGPMLVLAGAGSGKTRVITFRIAHLLDLGIAPSAICAVTFTNKAAEEMRERVAHLLGNKATAKKLTMGTFHALGMSILHAERRALGMPGGFVIYDQADQMGVLREAMRGVKDFSRDGEKRFDAKAILSRISLLKNSFIAPEDYQPTEGVDYDEFTQQVYPRYQEMLRSFAAFDFDDLIVEPVRLFEKNAEVRARWANKFQYVMVDEYQDTNRSQLMLVNHLVAQTGNLMVVGDDDQSIYSWRGADPTNILRFEEMFPGAKVVRLEQNYRSTKTILGAANAVIANNKQRHGKTLWSELGAGDPIIHAVAPNVEEEAKWVAREILKLKAEDPRLQFTDFAVMYRSNIQAKILEESLRMAEVPYVMYGGQQFFERKEVKDVIAYLRVAMNPRDDLALRRVLNYPARGIGATTVERLAAAAEARHAPLWTILRETAAVDAMAVETEDFEEMAAAAPVAVAAASADADDDDDPWATIDDDDVAAPRAVNPPASPQALAAAPAAKTSAPEGEIRGAAKKGIVEFVTTITRLGAAIDKGTGIVDAARQLMTDIGLVEDLQHASPSMSAAKRRIDNVEGLLGALGRHEERGKGRAALVDYLRKLTLETEDKKDNEDPNRIVLTTLHGSKGLEFPVCFIIGMEEELLPHKRTLQPVATDVMDGDHAIDLSEERRLCYVGITRAQRKLYLTRSCTRTERGRVIPRTHSRFLLEVPEELIEVIDIAETLAQQVPSTEVKNFFSSFASMLGEGGKNS